MPLTPKLHNQLREDMGMEPATHCAECWGVMENGNCKSCGSTKPYEVNE